uniref:Uncharacterized protein n=1 Tax=Eutreptiella gymnastica TaxID=73025 RepID=A0A6U8DUM5_9EUGL|mmetsp:Transcript_32521/g.58340  ORF Transcript_32521/g.58340 Transcript_32521/m.58340 type:complete len:107 (+) Transcript_32521:861-1181(+)
MNLTTRSIEPQCRFGGAGSVFRKVGGIQARTTGAGKDLRTVAVGSGDRTCLPLLRYWGDGLRVPHWVGANLKPKPCHSSPADCNYNSKVLRYAMGTWTERVSLGWG